MNDPLTEMDSIISELQEIAEDYQRMAAETQDELELMRGTLEDSRPI